MITLCIVAYNETWKLERVILQLTEVVDEIIVICNKFNRETCEVAERLADVVIKAEMDDVVPELHKNMAIENAKTDWILSLDPDEMVDDYLKERLKSRFYEDENYDGYFIRRINLERDELYRPNIFAKYPDFQLRLFKNYGKYPVGVHTRIDGLKDVNLLEIGYLIHDKMDVDRKEYERKIDLWKDFGGQGDGTR